MTDDEIDAAVDAMDIEAVARYARAHDVGDYDLFSWTDDTWPLKETELRIAVADYMKAEQGD